MNWTGVKRRFQAQTLSTGTPANRASHSRGSGWISRKTAFHPGRRTTVWLVHWAKAGKTPANRVTRNATFRIIEPRLVSFFQPQEVEVFSRRHCGCIQVTVHRRGRLTVATNDFESGHDV